MTAAMIAIENRRMPLPWSVVRRLSHEKQELPAQVLAGLERGMAAIQLKPTLTT
jgi:hypothetical protein